jgi:NAD(P)-dependent dehydrogenase (short-subunit alcohol dehydrogenase family)
MTDLQGKRALITGAANGIGEQIAELFARQGARVMLLDIQEEPLAKVAANLGVPSIQGDVSVAADIQAAVDATVDAFGGLDILVSNAGIEQVCSLAEHPEADFDRIVAVNVKSVLFGIQIGGPAIVRTGGGAIVNMSSVAGLGGCPMFGAYSATKAAVVSLTQTAALEFRGTGLRVNAVCPAFLQTEMVARAAPKLEAAFGIPLDGVIAQIQERLGTAREVATAVAYLASDEASFINGVAFPVDNALTARLI